MKDLRFYFDFSCPYAYVASTQVEALARRTGARLDVRPILLGGVFRAVDTPQNLSEVLPPPKARHNLWDIHRHANLHGAPVKMPAAHPMRTVEALRALLVVGEPFLPLAHELYRAYWTEGIQISSEDGLRAVLTRAGHDPDPILKAIADPKIKAELRARTDEAIETGVFGVPTFVVDDELYWGQDRMYMVERALGGTPPMETPRPRLPVDVYFDYASPFAYLGCERAERALGDGARWHPMLLGAVFRGVGTPDVPLFEQNEAKRRFTLRDLERQAAELDVPFKFPTHFPMRTVLPLRVTLLARAHETAEGRRLVHRLHRAFWAENLDISSPDVVRGLCDELGLDGAGLVEAASSPEAKQMLRATTDAAVAAGVFGAPTFIVHTDRGPQLFWGSDRMEMVLRAAAGDTRVYVDAA